MDNDFMKKALKLAGTSGKDIPIAAVIVKDGKIIAKGVNQREKKQNTVNHAEIIAIQKANKKLGNWRLNDCEMYVTLEPCPMCASAILQARISKLYFGAYDLLTGSFGSKCDMRTVMGYDIYVKGGILEEECVKLLKNYFERLR
ncbi:MAG: nucleoside deaminase [Candidatus Gastranaerophilales bacterium]|nr:nucleoside deaminase [Candidatus Gastranaerophilales bacterium]